MIDQRLDDVGFNIGSSRPSRSTLIPATPVTNVRLMSCKDPFLDAGKLVQTLFGSPPNH